MNIEVMGRYEAVEYSARYDIEKTGVISITAGHGCDNVNFYLNSKLHILPMNFDDVSEDTAKYRAISDYDAALIVRFVNNMIELNAERIIVQCEAGISRSAGVAAAILKHVYNDDSAIFKSYKYKPNMTCYNKVLTAFKCSSKCEEAE